MSAVPSSINTIPSPRALEFVSSKEKRINLHHCIDLAAKAQRPNVYGHEHNSCTWGSAFCQWGKNEWCKPRFLQTNNVLIFTIHIWFWPEAGQEFVALAFSKLVWHLKMGPLTCFGDPAFKANNLTHYTRALLNQSKSSFDPEWSTRLHLWSFPLLHSCTWIYSITLPMEIDLRIATPGQWTPSTRFPQF